MSELTWSGEHPTEPGWYWVRSKQLSARPVKFHGARWGGITGHGGLPTNWDDAFGNRHENKEYAGPIPQPSEP